MEAEPDRSAKELLERLHDERPGAFTNGQLRTLQRRVRAWRAATAKRLVFGAGLSTETHVIGDAAVLRPAWDLAGDSLSLKYRI